MDGLLKSLTTAFSRITLGRETQAIRDRYFTDAEAAIRNNSQFNWFTAKIAIWQLRRNRRKMERMWGLILDPSLHKAIGTYVEELSPIIETIMTEEVAPALEDHNFEEITANLNDLVNGKAARA